MVLQEFVNWSWFISKSVKPFTSWTFFNHCFFNNIRGHLIVINSVCMLQIMRYLPSKPHQERFWIACVLWALLTVCIYIYISIYMFFYNVCCFRSLLPVTFSISFFMTKRKMILVVCCYVSTKRNTFHSGNTSWIKLNYI